jgi:hypothetical protein
VILGSHEVSGKMVQVSLSALFSLYKIKMPGYGGKRMEMYTPEPTEEVNTVEKRFVMPKLTIVQMVLVAAIAVYAFTARKNKGMVVGAIALSISLLHFYDHLYRVKRGSEQLFFLPKKEKYGCQMCK